ncbi:right-handed parallel beta-helix repeat-containing protein [Natranaerobius thermophilus]|uniref:right-handed parallel beta-helix repeat-containing protein n=1 Tax=Natranaerobius thermophilus TaxID=375929 RepID=UPI00059D7710|nr:right-handed parallel beta-helix repeat-containing protein [Natranaerobius thermophilus]
MLKWENLNLPKLKTSAIALALIGFMSFIITGCSGDEEVGDIIVPEDYETIQEAIDASEDGEIIMVEPGTYEETIDFKGKDITLMSTDPHDEEVVSETIIDGGGDGSVVTFQSGESKDAQIRGFTITGGTGTEIELKLIPDSDEVAESWILGGGVLIDDDSSAAIKHNKIHDNYATYGGAITVSNESDAVVEDNMIKDNKTEFDASAIQVVKESDIKISDNVISNNISEDGVSTISAYSHSEALIDNNNIKDNSTKLGVTILANYKSELQVKDNIIENNFAEVSDVDSRLEGMRQIGYSQPSGSVLINSSTATIKSNVISDEDEMTGISIKSDQVPVVTEKGEVESEFKIPEVLVKENEITKNWVSGIYTLDAEVDIINNLIHNNNSFGISSLDNTTINITDNEIVDNRGSGVYDFRSKEGVLKNNKIKRNVAREIEELGFDEPDGGGVLIMHGGYEWKIIGNDIVGNEAEGFGGGIALTNSATYEDHIIEDNHIVDNKAQIDGGGIFSLEMGDKDIFLGDNEIESNVPNDIAESQ